MPKGPSGQTRKLAALLVVLCAPAWATEAALPPGRPAGVKPAIAHSTEVYILFGAAAIATAAGLLLFHTSKSSSATPTATSP